MNRRDAVLALTALGLAPLGAYAQRQTKVWRMGFLYGRSRPTPSNPEPYLDAFLQGLRDLGYVEGRNLVIEWRFADGKFARFAGLAAELVKMNPDVIVTSTTAAAHALNRTTSTIPLVFAALFDPVGSGLVASLARPGGNITGASSMVIDVVAKQVELLKSTTPALVRLAALHNPVSTAIYPSTMNNIQAAAERLGMKTIAVSASSPEDIGRAFATIARENAGAVIVTPDTFLISQRSKIAELAVSNRMPTMNSFQEDVSAGGLMSYGPDLADVYRRGAAYVDKIFKGAKPANLPIEQPTKLELVINLKTARAIGITIPQSILLRADRVIE